MILPAPAPPPTSASSTTPWSAHVGGLLVLDDGRPFSVEICAGSARLSLALSRMGFNAVGVDYGLNKHRPVAPVAMLDLTSPEGVSGLETLLTHPKLSYVHAAPPCGTYRFQSKGEASARVRRPRPPSSAL